MKYDVCVIGAGPGGYVAAIRSAQLGLKTAIIEREALGGVCLNVGCIPSKAMITAAHFLHRAQHDSATMGIEIDGPIRVNMSKLHKWQKSVCNRMSGGVEQLLKGNKVDVISGEASFVSTQQIKIKSSKGDQALDADNFIIATGSRPIEIPGFAIDEKNVLSSTGALDLKELPKKVAIVGGGYIGLEIGSYLAKLGSHVEIFEASDELLKGVVDSECVKVVERKLKKSGVRVHTSTFAKSYKKSGAGYIVEAEVKGEKKEFVVDKILLTVGRKPNSDQANLKEIGIKIDDHGFVQTDAQRRTNYKNIYAIGDLCGQPMLAHKASHEGILVAEVISGKNRVYDAKTVPAVMFVDPEIASVGMTEQECKDEGYTNLLVNKFPFAANGRAVSMIETDGFIKIVANADNHVVLGVHMVGPEVSNLISEAALAIEMGATLEDIALTIHPHPTLGETMMEAAEATLGHAIHIIQKPLKTSPAKPPSAHA